jgi:hypothetical protein
MKEKILRTGALHSLTKHAGEGTIEVHNQMDLQTLESEFIGHGGGGNVYKTTIDDQVLALKVLHLNDHSSHEDQKICFRREIAFMRFVSLFASN